MNYVTDYWYFIVFFFLVLFLFWYFSNIKRFRPDQVVSIDSHARHVNGEDERRLVRSKIMKGGGSIYVNPLTSRYYVLSTSIISINIDCNNLMTEDEYIVNAKATMTFSIDDSTEESIRNAFKNFGKYSVPGIKGFNSEQKISEQIKDIFENGIKDVIGKMTAKDIFSNSNEIADNAQEYIKARLIPLGLIIKSVGIKKPEILDEEYEKRRKQVKERMRIEEEKKTKEVIRAIKDDDDEYIRNRDLKIALSEEDYKAKTKIKEKESEQEVAQMERIIENEREEHRINISKKKKERLAAEEGYLAKEEESIQNVLLVKKRAAANVEKIIAEINAETTKINKEAEGSVSFYEARLKRDIELMKAFTRYENLSAEAKGQAELIEAMNTATSGAILQSFYRQNPEIVEKVIEKILGQDGLTGVASGVSQHLSNIESLRIADIGGGSSGADGNVIDKIVDLPPNVLTKLIAKLNMLGLGDLVDKIKDHDSSFDNMGYDKEKPDYQEKHVNSDISPELLNRKID